MSKQCPHCGSYNTEAAIENYVGRGFVQVGRCILVTGAMTLGSLVGPTAGKAAGKTVWDNTKPGELKGHRCCNCGNLFK